MNVNRISAIYAPLYAEKALLLGLGLPSTLIRHENGAFRKRYSNWNLKTLALRVILHGKHFGDEARRKLLSDDNHEIPPDRL